MNRTHKIGGALFVLALMASVVIPAFAENRGMTGTSTRPYHMGLRNMGMTGTSTGAFLGRGEKERANATANQCLRDAVKNAQQAYRSAMQKAQDDYKAAMMAARQAMLDAKKKAQTDMMAAKSAAKAQCGINTQTGTSTAPNL